MKEIRYRLFLSENNVRPETLDKGLRKKIKIFERMEKRVDELEEPDRKKLQGRLKTLDMEIHEDLLEAFQDELENNDELEDDMLDAVERNEAIIERYFLKGIYRTSRSELRKKGFLGNLSGKEIIVGRFRLTRLIFSYNYRIELVTPLTT